MLAGEVESIQCLSSTLYLNTIDCIGIQSLFEEFPGIENNIGVGAVVFSEGRVLDDDISITFAVTRIAVSDGCKEGTKLILYRMSALLVCVH
jgi:hypothetical protein